MAEAFKQYWYLILALVLLVILTLWVIKKAALASQKYHGERQRQMEKLEYEAGVLKDFAALSEEKLKAADKKRAFDGVAMNIQKTLEKQPNMDSAFAALPEAQRRIYALYYLAEDSRDGLSEFFKCNSAPLTPVARDAVRELLPQNAVEAFEKEYNAYDPEDEVTSLIKGEIDENDRAYAEAMENFDFYTACVDYIIKNLPSFQN